MESIGIVFRGCKPSGLLLAAARESLRDVESRVGAIDRGRILLGPRDPFRVTLDLAYRHYRVFVVREALDAQTAIARAFQAAEQQMLEIKRRQDEGERLTA